MNKKMKYNYGGGKMSNGDGDKFVPPSEMNNPRVGMVDRFAAMGGAMGTEDVMDVYKKGGGTSKKMKGTKKGMMRKTARRAYKK